jgi:hypothetical protein
MAVMLQITVLLTHLCHCINLPIGRFTLPAPRCYSLQHGPTRDCIICSSKSYTIDHTILLHTFESDSGVVRNAHMWIASFLLGREQHMLLIEFNQKIMV